MLLMGCVVCGPQPNQYAMSSDRPVVRPSPLTALVAMQTKDQ